MNLLYVIIAAAALLFFLGGIFLYSYLTGGKHKLNQFIRHYKLKEEDSVLSGFIEGKKITIEMDKITVSHLNNNIPPISIVHKDAAEFESAHTSPPSFNFEGKQFEDEELPGRFIYCPFPPAYRQYVNAIVKSAISTLPARSLIRITPRQLTYQKLNLSTDDLIKHVPRLVEMAGLIKQGMY